MRGGNGRVAIRQPVGLRLASLDGQTLSLCHGAADTPALPSTCLSLSLLSLSPFSACPHRLSRRHVAPLCDCDGDSDNFISKRKAYLWAPLKMINARRLAAKKAAIRQRARSANLFVPAPTPCPPRNYPSYRLPAAARTPHWPCGGGRESAHFFALIFKLINCCAAAPKSMPHNISFVIPCVHAAAYPPLSQSHPLHCL